MLNLRLKHDPVYAGLRFDLYRRGQQLAANHSCCLRAYVQSQAPKRLGLPYHVRLYNALTKGLFGRTFGKFFRFPPIQLIMCVAITLRFLPAPDGSRRCQGRFYLVHCAYQNSLICFYHSALDYYCQ